MVKDAPAESDVEPQTKEGRLSFEDEKGGIVRGVGILAFFSSTISLIGVVFGVAAFIKNKLYLDQSVCKRKRNGTVFYCKTDAYEKVMDILCGSVADYVEQNPDLRTQPTEDMWDFKDEEEDQDDSWDAYHDMSRKPEDWTEAELVDEYEAWKVANPNV